MVSLTLSPVLSILVGLSSLLLLGLSSPSRRVDPPIANPDTYVIHGLTSIGPLHGNDTPPPGGFINLIQIVSPPSNGTLSTGSLGNFSYTPRDPKAGSDSFTYKACMFENCSNPATVSLTYNNAAPIALSDFYVVHGLAGTVGPFLQNDFDPDGDTFLISDSTEPRHGIYQSSTTPGLGSYVVDSSSFTGLDSFSYRLIDSVGVHSSIAFVFIFVVNNTGDENLGAAGCNSRVGQPVNVTNGNMYTQQTDYRLPGVGPSIDITRTYNSLSQSSGIFGAKWSTVYDERITVYSDNLLRLELSDGRAVYFGRTGSSGPFNPVTPQFFGSIVKNSNGSYTFSTTDGEIHQFSPVGMSPIARLVSIADRNNNQTTLTYDGNGHLATITDAFNRTVTVFTDTSGRVTKLTDDAGVIADYAYDGTGADQFTLHSVKFPDGSKSVFTHTMIGGNQYLTTITNALGHVVEHHDYNSDGKALTSERQNGIDKYTLNYVSTTETDVTDAEGHLTKYTYQTNNGRNLVTKIEGTCGCGGGSQIQQWDYDNKGNVVTMTNALNQVSSATYDANGNPLTMTDLDGTSTYTYNAFSEMLTATDPMGGVTTLTYDTQGNLLTVKDALNHTTTLAVNSRGQVTSVKDARPGVNNTTAFAYTNADLMSVTNSLNHITSYTYWPRGWLKTVSEPVTQAGSPVTLTTQYEYDLVGRPKKKIYPDAAHSFVENVYDTAGRLTQTKDALGNTTNFAYDDTQSSYRLASITDPLGHSTTFGYTPMSRLLYQTDALSHRTDYEYDAFSRLKRVIYPAETSTAPRLDEEYSYDALGRVTQQLDTANNPTSYTYDDVGRVYTVTDALNRQTKSEYNQRHQLTKLTDALLQVYDFVPDALGHVTSVTRGGNTMHYHYDEVGNRDQRTDYNGGVTNYEYDKLNRLHKITYPEATTATYEYDEISRLLSATNQNGAVSFVYDNRSQVVSTTDVLGKTINYTYDANGNRKTMTSGTALSVSYDTYDAANRLTRMTDTAGRVFNFAYNEVNQISSVARSGGSTSTYSYDGMNRLKDLTQSAGAVHFDFHYTYDQALNIQQIASSADTRTYTYDALNRLTAVANSSGANESYSYDAVGNRTASHHSSSYTLQPYNRVTATTSATYGYDANGNMTSRTDASGRWYFTWDGENRLVRVLKPGWRPVSARTITYAYDALGRRIERNSKSGGSQTYTYDGQNTVLDQNPDGSQTAYTNGPGIDNKLGQVQGGNQKYYFSDHLGSTAGLTDANGQNSATISYASFGRSTSSSNTRFTYTGREADPDTGLMYYRARWYDPQLGRFISEDPIGFAGGDINLYGYVGNNPLRGVDPSGLIPSVNNIHSWRDIRTASDIADWMDNNVDYSVKEYSRSDDHWIHNGLMGTAGDLIKGLWDFLRLGNGIGRAGSESATIGDKILGPVQDYLRLGALVGTIAGPANWFANRFSRPPACNLEAELTNAAGRASATVGEGSGPVYGTKVHTAFEQEVQALPRADLSTEISYLYGQVARRGKLGSIRVDVVQGPLKAPTAIFDLKTGSAILSPSRISQIQAHVPGGSAVPITMIKP